MKVTLALDLEIEDHQAAQVLAKGDDPSSGYLRLAVNAVHAHTCPAWRGRARVRSCKCGAHALFKAWLKKVKPIPAEERRRCAACGRTLPKRRNTCRCGCWNKPHD